MDKKKQRPPKPKTFIECFEGLPDPRLDRHSSCIRRRVLHHTEDHVEQRHIRTPASRP